MALFKNLFKNSNIEEKCNDSQMGKYNFKSKDNRLNIYEDKIYKARPLHIKGNEPLFL